MKFVMYSVWGISKGGKERGSGDVSLKGKILKGDVKGGQLRMPSLLTPSCICGMGWDFSGRISTAVEGLSPTSRPAELNTSFRIKFIKKSKFIKFGSVFP